MVLVLDHFRISKNEKFEIRKIQTNKSVKYIFKSKYHSLNSTVNEWILYFKRNNINFIN